VSFQELPQVEEISALQSLQDAAELSAVISAREYTRVVTPSGWSE